MPVHLIKLCVGCADPAELRAHHGTRLAEGKPLIHRTRHMPRRATEILAGGSLYWVFSGTVSARQTITALEPESDAEGRPYCVIHLGPDLVGTHPMPFRPFQGWRYLSPDKAPEDLGGADGEGALPYELLQELRRLGLH